MDYQSKVNCMWESIIESYMFDALTHCINMELKLIENQIVTTHKMTIYGVKSILYLNDAELYMPEDGDYLELTSITIDISKVNKIETWNIEKKSQHLESQANVILEIWNREVLIDAVGFILDGQKYEF